MNREFSNVYGDERRAGAYADLEFPGTYYLAFRDLPELIGKHVKGPDALDFGCGTGRSSRFLKELGFGVIGIDIAEAMLGHARERDPDGDYRLVPDGNLSPLNELRFDLVFSAFTFDNIPDAKKRTALLRDLGRLLKEEGRIINLVSAPEIYVNEWTSFSTEDFPENKTATSGDLVQIVMLDVPDQRPVEDIFWADADYRDQFENAALELLETHHPLGKDSDPYTWASENRVSPWSIYVLRQEGRTGT
ncbi:MAG: class I SAM-dependent methyltransferase [Gemmatimonadetes bacterium]|nr:class I SAM-dependent methyltransferase [Gemmatimonadota bacterium]